MSNSRIHHSPYGPLTVATDQSVAQFLTRWNPDDVSGDKVILSDFDDASSTLTFDGIRIDPAKGATGLVNLLALKEGDVVCIVALNSVNWVLLAHSVMWAGAIFAGINAVATSYELVHYFAIARPSLVAVDMAMLAKVEEALRMSKDLDKLPNILLIEDGSRATQSRHLLFPRDVLNFSAAKALPFDLTYRDNRTVPAAMCFSSGTSGQPKGVLLSHYAMIAYPLSLRISAPALTNCHQSEVFFPPFAHIYGIAIAVMTPAFTGQHVVAMKKYDFIAYLQKSAEIRATVARLVPATAIQMIKDSRVKDMDLRSINTVFCSGASLSDAVAEALSERLGGISVLNGYGMSEGAITTIRETQAATRPGSVGKPSAGVQIRVVDNDYQDVKPGEQGECLVKAHTAFMGYIRNVEATRETFRDGWLCTGDVVRYDEDGYFYLTGRKKELIKFKGNQVPPAELEAVLLSHPLVNDAGVCGEWDDELQTEVPTAYVNFIEDIPRSCRERRLQEIKAFVDERVSPFKKLRGGLHYLEILPKGPTGKLVRRDLPAAKKERKPAKL